MFDPLTDHKTIQLRYDKGQAYLAQTLEKFVFSL